MSVETRMPAGGYSAGAGRLRADGASGAGEPHPMEVTGHQRAGGVVTVTIRGDLTGGAETDRLVRVLHTYLVEEGVREVRVDVAGVGFLNSVALARLIMLRREALNAGIRLRLVGATGQVRAKLDLTGVLDLLSGEG